ncbi:MAG: Uma2 family endonuclease [Candidatus Rokubacteria bacterium]|nr:Uma2 family endonuclease [Candidatus Rokubacteria bacterium]
MAVELKRRRFTVDDYHRMAAAGILTADDRVELLDGEIVEMAPIGPRHASITDRLARLFMLRLGTRVIVRAGGPILLARQDSEPQPDITLLRPRADFYSRAHPEPRDVFLAVEVMDTTADRDRRVKLPLYGRAELAEIWLVDAVREAVEIYRRSVSGSAPEIMRGGERVTIAAFPDVTFAVDEIFG